MARLTRSMYHKDLQPAYGLGRAVTWIGRRNWGLRMMHRFMMLPLVGNNIDGVDCTEIYIPSVATAGHKIRARVYISFWLPFISPGHAPLTMHVFTEHTNVNAQCSCFQFKILIARSRLFSFQLTFSR